MTLDIESLAWDKQGGLLPAIVQDAGDGRVLMLGYMDRAALERTIEGNLVSFFSRSRNTPWTKGETSGNTLALVSVEADCDGDTLLVQARPHGPTCHLQRASCFAGAPADFVRSLDAWRGPGEAQDGGADGCEAAAVDGADAFAEERFGVGAGAVALVPGEAVRGVHGAKLAHDVVSRHLRDDRRGGDGDALRVALDDGPLGQGH